MADNPKLYTSPEVAAILGRADTTIRKLAQRKGIGQKCGPAWVFTDADIELLRQVDPRGGVPKKDGSAPEHTAGFDKIKNRGRKRKTPDESL